MFIPLLCIKANGRSISKHTLLKSITRKAQAHCEHHTRTIPWSQNSRLYTNGKCVHTQRNFEGLLLLTISNNESKKYQSIYDSCYIFELHVCGDPGTYALRASHSSEGLSQSTHHVGLHRLVYVSKISQRSFLSREDRIKLHNCVVVYRGPQMQCASSY